MQTDLEDRLRAALHERGDSITPARLRAPDHLRTHAPVAPRSRAARWAPFAAAAAVVALVLGLTLLLRDGGSPSNPAGGGSDLTGIKGHVWTMISVQAPDGSTTAIPSSVGATVTFLGDGKRIAFRDAQSSYNGQITPAGEGMFRVHAIGGDYNGIGSNDPARKAAAAVTGALSVPTGGRSTIVITLALDAGQLELDVQGYTVLLDKPAPVPASASVEPSVATQVSTTAAVPVSSTPGSDPPSGINGSESPGSTTGGPGTSVASGAPTSSHR